MALSKEEKFQVMRKAIALYFDCDEDTVGNFVFAAEREVDGHAIFSGGWSDLAHWYALGLCNELRVMLDRQRGDTQPAISSLEQNGELPPNLENLLRSAK